MKHGKKYLESVKLIERNKLYDPDEAIKLALETAKTKFDETLEVSVRLGVDTRKADQNVRGSISLPNGIGKEVRVAVFAEGEKAREAEAAGADIVGSDDLVADIQAGNINFDAAIATPDQMPKVGRLGKILGPRGLMPNPKLGTVTPDVARAVTEVKAGKIEYRLDKSNIIHCPIGKASFGEEKIKENFDTLLSAIIKAKPAVFEPTHASFNFGKLSLFTSATKSYFSPFTYAM